LWEYKALWNFSTIAQSNILYYYVTIPEYLSCCLHMVQLNHRKKSIIQPLWHCFSSKNFISIFKIFLAVLEFEVRASLQHPTTWPTYPALFALIYFSYWVLHFCPQPVSDHDLSISTFQIAGIIGIHHHAWPTSKHFKKTSCTKNIFAKQPSSLHFTHITVKLANGL
jgi:hypothetical protein